MAAMVGSCELIIVRKMEPVQGEGDLSEVFLVLGPPEEALEHRPRVPREWRALGVGQPEVCQDASSLLVPLEIAQPRVAAKS